MPARTEVLSNRTIGGEKSLRMTQRFEALQAPLPLAYGLVRVLGVVVEITVRATFHPR